MSESDGENVRLVGPNGATMRALAASVMSGYAALTRPTWPAWSDASSEVMQECRVTLR